MALLQHRLLIASGMAAFACVNRWMKTGAPRCMGNVIKGQQPRGCSVQTLEME